MDDKKKTIAEILKLAEELCQQSKKKVKKVDKVRRSKKKKEKAKIGKKINYPSCVDKIVSRLLEDVD